MRVIGAGAGSLANLRSAAGVEMAEGQNGAVSYG